MIPGATYDADVDVVVVELSAGPVAGTIPFPDDSHLVDVDEHGAIVAIEILSPDDLKLEAIADRFGLDQETALEIESMIARATELHTGAAGTDLRLRGHVRHALLHESAGTRSVARNGTTLELEPAC